MPYRGFTTITVRKEIKEKLDKIKEKLSKRDNYPYSISDVLNMILRDYEIEIIEAIA